MNSAETRCNYVWQLRIKPTVATLGWERIGHGATTTKKKNFLFGLERHWPWLQSALSIHYYDHDYTLLHATPALRYSGYAKRIDEHFLLVMFCWPRVKCWQLRKRCHGDGLGCHHRKWWWHRASDLFFLRSVHFSFSPYFSICYSLFLFRMSFLFWGYRSSVLPRRKIVKKD